jgi:hypothetical protein
VSDKPPRHSRRDALKCMAYGGAGTLFILAGGVFAPVDLAMAAEDQPGAARLGKPLFVQISDTHIGFNKDANPDVNGTLTRTIDLVNEMAEHQRSSFTRATLRTYPNPQNSTWRGRCSPVCARLSYILNDTTIA